MKSLSVCETDLKIISGQMKTKKLPIVLGHEGGGMVESAGSDDNGSLMGQRVLVDPNVCDYTCPECINGNYQLCDNGGLMGREQDGLFAERVSVNAKAIYQVPQTISDQVVPLLQPLSTAMHALRKVEVFPWHTVVVMGLGPTGLMFSSVAKSKGATVIGATRSKRKLELSRKFGVDHSVSVLDQDVQHEVKEITGGTGADTVIEAVGDPEVLDQCFRLVRKGGTILQFGVSNSTATYSMYAIYEKELSLLGTRSSVPSDFLAAISFASSGKVDLESLVTERFSFESIEKAIESSKPSSGNLKVTISL
jgi:2-desacetyl-2-hydroxyethyl bacteriochlorophyllide A dehydrogenase